MAEQITLYESQEFRKLFHFVDVKYDWLNLLEEKHTLVDARNASAEDQAEARRVTNEFIAGDSSYIHPWELAVSGYFDLPERFIVEA